MPALSLRLVAVAAALTLAAAYDQSLSACKAIAAKFRNTCAHGDYDTPAVSVAGMEAEAFTCPSKPACIPAGTKTGADCTWQRRLCVTCREDGGVTKIRVQTNNLPDHCVQSIQIKEQEFDTEVVFNSKKVYGASGWNKSPATQTQLNNAVCRISKNYNAAQLGIVEMGGTNRVSTKESVNSMGVAVNGVAFQFANQIREDPVYPITIVNEQPLDLCLGHNQRNAASGMYHYHAVSPCMMDGNFLTGRDMSDCASNAECHADKVAWALKGFEASQYRTQTVIGVAKDGHVLYGMYDSSGALWSTTTVDACNGVWDPTKQDYFYVATRWHPYLIGCMGPANQPHKNAAPLYAKCSLNGMERYVGSSLGSSPSILTSSTSTSTLGGEPGGSQSGSGGGGGGANLDNSDDAQATDVSGSWGRGGGAGMACWFGGTLVTLLMNFGVTALGWQ